MVYSKENNFHIKEEFVSFFNSLRIATQLMTSVSPLMRVPDRFVIVKNSILAYSSYNLLS